MSSPDSLLNLSLLNLVRITTLINGGAQESFVYGSLFGLQLITLFNDPSRFMLIVETTNNFDAVEISQGAVVGAWSSLDVYAMCVAPAAI